jgi:ABC-2 type transport system ATP-binding protein
MSPSILEVRDLKKSYGSNLALAGVTFNVAEGEMFGLLGPNGAGKTTLLSILSCLIAADSGSARILNHGAAPGNRELCRHIGIVPQELALYGELTASENLAFFGRLYGLRAMDLWRRVGEVLDGVGLSDRANRRVETFSGGMKRRLNLGIALMHRPRLLMLDEPTTGVDPQSRNHIFEEVRRLNAQGTTVIYTSHYMEEVQALCSRIGIMDHGQLIACDTLSALLQQLPGLIRCRLSVADRSFGDEIASWPGVRVLAAQADALTLECTDVKATLVRLLTLLNDRKVEISGLEIEEPNLERVFLHLTGQALRD